MNITSIYVCKRIHNVTRVYKKGESAFTFYNKEGPDSSSNVRAVSVTNNGAACSKREFIPLYQKLDEHIYPEPNQRRDDCPEKNTAGCFKGW